MREPDYVYCKNLIAELANYGVPLEAFELCIPSALGPFGALNGLQIEASQYLDGLSE
jgi:hypothetical protein